MVDEQAHYWSRIAREYDRVVDLQIGPRTRSMVRERLAQEGPLGSVAEFGCGTGFYTGVLAERAERIVATDRSPGMLDLARQRLPAASVTFQVEDCQQTSLPDGAFDTAFMSLVIHFTDPRRTLAEMGRILKPGGTLIVVNLDPWALGRLGRLRCAARVLFHGIVGYRTRPPKGFGRHLLTQQRLCELLGQAGFEVSGAEAIQDASRSSNIPVEYVRAVKG